MFNRRRLAVTFILGAIAALFLAAAQAQAWPTRPVRFIVSLGPGAGVDIVARMFADKLSAKWGQPVVVENKPGGDAIVAISAMINARDDHVLLFTPASAFTGHPLLYQKLPYDPKGDGGGSWTEITDGLPTEFGFAAAAHPHDRDTFYVIPLDPGHGRLMPDGQAAVWRTQDAGSTWQRLANGLPQRDAYVGVLREGMAIDSYDEPGVYFGTSTGQLFASADAGESWSEVASYLPGITSVEVAIVE